MTALPQVLILSGVSGDTRRYRALHPVQQLRLAGVPCASAHLTSPNLEKAFEAAAVIILHRAAWDSRLESLVRRAQQRGALVLGDTDDLVFDAAAFKWIDSPDFKDPIRARLYRAEMLRHRQTLEACGTVITSTEYLSGQVQAQLGKTAPVHRNAFSLEMLACAEAALKARPAHPGRLVAGYASGTPTHDHDFALATPALQAALARHPELELWLVGPLQLDESWNALLPRVKRCSFVPWRSLPQTLAQFDINLAPLAMDNPFCQSKSEIKFMEAALVQTPTIASATPAFCHAIRSGENGFLARSSGDWAAALEALISQPELRANMARQARQDVLAAYAPQRMGRQLAALIEQAAGRPLWPEAELRPAAPPEAALDAAWEAHPTGAERALYTLRRRGPLTLLGLGWVFFRRLAAPIFPFR
ncbi:MAG TPA: glycosyltransferase family 4 protein [Anaerolineaceae bacterium]|nr:glycosyltransferase family 4 protein [Anaerolineaceae bacterium]HPN52061.1 glycosyltransferase family 4 protein [Anaerolineaceae bacterium]